MTTEKKPTKQMFVTGRASYVNVFKPRPPPPGQTGDPKYGLSILIPKADKAQVKAVRSAIEEIAKGAWGPSAPKLIEGGKIKSIFRDGDLEEGKQGYAGHYFFNATASRKPGVVDKNRQPVEDPEEFYSGCYVQASVTFYAYDAAGSKGVSAGLNNIRVIKKGERLDGRVAAEAEQWPEVEGEDDDGGEGGGAPPAEDASDLL